MTHFDETFCRACGETYPNCTCSGREAAFRQGVQLGKVEAQQQIERAERERDAAADLAREECAKICEQRSAFWGSVKDYRNEAAALDCSRAIRSAIADPTAVKEIINGRKDYIRLRAHLATIATGHKLLQEFDAARTARNGEEV